VTSSDYVYLGSGILALAAFWLIMRLILTKTKDLSPGGNLWKQGNAYSESEKQNNDQMQRVREGWARSWPVAAVFVVVGAGLIIAGAVGT
jgi:hypothetical protein